MIAMRPSIRTSVTTSLVLAAPLALAACVAGPDYRGPPSVAPHASASGQFHRGTAALVVGAPPPARWWEALNDPILTRLIDRALARSPTLHEAQARVRAARARLGEVRSRALPVGGGRALGVAARVPTGALSSLSGRPGSDSGATSDIDLYSVGFDASWELDVFGGVRRGVEAASAQAAAQAAQAQDAQVELAAEVAQAYVSFRNAQAQLRLAQESHALQRQILDLVSQRRARGAATDGDVERVQAGLDQADVQMAPLQGQLEQIADRIALLTGGEPGARDAELAAAAAAPMPPAVTPVGDPAALLRRRPDIRAAERRLAASQAQIGQNVAQLFPSVTLLGDLGFVSTGPGRLLGADAFSAIGAPSLSWRILSYPQVRAQIRGAIASRDAEAARYEATVLAALRDAEAALSRFGHQRQSLVALVRVDAAAGRAVALAQVRYQGGTGSLIDVLQAARQQNEIQRSLVESQAQLTKDYVALQKSLGLGWGETTASRGPDEGGRPMTQQPPQFTTQGARRCPETKTRWC